MMGRQDGEQDSDIDESPRHRVTISEGFWMSKYEVTQGQWEAVMGSNPARNYGVGDNYPVYYVSWDDIQDFESSLDHGYRLPSESEWEYACRADTQTRFYWGDDANYSEIGTYAWYSSNSSSRTHPVGEKEPNVWGLHDMSGNVWEWCEDVWHSDYNGAPENGGSWTTGGDQGRRVLRGGSWNNNVRYCRSADRYWGNYDNRFNNYGFRLVLCY